MCYDMCLRSLDDTLQTMEGMRYRRMSDAEESAEVSQEVEHLTKELSEIRKKMGSYEGAHLDETVKCNLCNVYHHHSHNKVEWRSEKSEGGYDEDVEWSVRADGARYAMRPASPYADV